MTKYQECDYDFYFISFPEPYILESHKKYFFVACDQIVRTNQNHKFLLYYHLLLKYFQALYLYVLNLICEDNKSQNIPI